MPISSLYLSEQLADVHFTVANTNGEIQRIPAHTQIICVDSEPLCAMFYGEFGKPPEVDIPDADADSFKAFLKYLYCGSTELSDANVFAVMYLAKKYLTDPLAVSCHDYIERMTFESTNVLRILIQAFQYGDVPDKVWMEVERYAADVLNSNEFLSLERTLVRELLKRNELRVSETVVYSRLKQWTLQQMTNNRSLPSDAEIRCFLGADLWLVRFAQMTAEEFAEGPAKDECLTAQEKVDIYGFISSKKVREEQGSEVAHICTVKRCSLIFRRLAGVTIEVLVRGDGRNFPKLGQTVHYRCQCEGIDFEYTRIIEACGNGFNEAFRTMSIGEKAKITVDRSFLKDSDGKSFAKPGETSRTVFYTLLGIE